MKKFGLTAIVFAALGASSLMMGCDSDGNHVTAHDDSDLNQPISLFDTLMVPSVANLRSISSTALRTRPERSMTFDNRRFRATIG